MIGHKQNEITILFDDMLIMLMIVLDMGDLYKDERKCENVRIEMVAPFSQQIMIADWLGFSPLADPHSQLPILF